MSVYEEFLKLKEEKAALDAKILANQCALYELFATEFNKKDEGSVSIKDQGFKLTVTKRLNINVDQKLAQIIKTGFKIKYEFSKTEYNKLTDEQKAMVNDCIVIEPGKPGFEVKRLLKEA